MGNDLVDRICGSFPGAVRARRPDGELESWKVGGKMFACFSGHDDGVSVKTADTETAQFLIEIGRATRAPYFHKSWVRVDPESIDVAELTDRLATSYDLIRARLPKALRADLPARKTAE